jgi:hypothetical protein
MIFQNVLYAARIWTHAEEVIASTNLKLLTRSVDPRSIELVSQARQTLKWTSHPKPAQTWLRPAPSLQLRWWRDERDPARPPIGCSPHSLSLTHGPTLSWSTTPCLLRLRVRPRPSCPSAHDLAICAASGSAAKPVVNRGSRDERASHYWFHSGESEVVYSL